VLGDLNEAIRRESPRSRFCTVVYVSLKRTGDLVTGCVATGGHPLPLILRADGRVETAGTPGTLLGILPEPEISREELVLRPGDALVLYTDGVTEATPLDGRYGPEPLARTVADCSGRAAVAIAHRIEREVLAVQGGKVRDDVAIVVLRVGWPPVAPPFVAQEPGVAAST
jgi:phosphoserine phosphatase RsbU/P